MTEPEAIEMSGVDPDYSKRQLWDMIEEGKEVVWKANVQIMQPEDADANKLAFDPFDVTKGRTNVVLFWVGQVQKLT